MAPVSSDGAPGRPRHRCPTFVLMQDEVENEIFQAVRKTKLPLDVHLELQNEALFEPAIPHRKAVAIGILLL